MRIPNIDAEFDDEILDVLRGAMSEHGRDNPEPLPLRSFLNYFIRLSYPAEVLTATRKTAEFRNWLVDNAHTFLQSDTWSFLAEYGGRIDWITSKELWERFLERLGDPDNLGQGVPMVTQDLVNWQRQSALAEAAFGPPPPGEDSSGNEPVTAPVRLIAGDEDLQKANELIDEIIKGIDLWFDFGLPEEVVQFFENDTLPKLEQLKRLISEPVTPDDLTQTTSDAKIAAEGVRGALGSAGAFLKDRGAPVVDIALKAKALYDLIPLG